MFAVAAVIAFAIAFILHLVGNGTGKIVTDAVLIGFVLVAAHLAWGVFVALAQDRHMIVREFEDATNTRNITPGDYAALYIDGDFKATQADADRFPHHRWITVLGDPDAGCGDYEPGNELYEAPGRLRAWVTARHAAGKRARVYCDRANAAQAANAVAGVPHLWWISTLDGKRWTAAELVAELERFGVTISPAHLWAVQFEGGISAGHDTSILLGEW